MSRLGMFAMGLVVGGAAVFTSLKYHVVRTNEGVELVPKFDATFSETYIDTRNFDVSDWAEHKTLTAAIVRADKQHILQGSAAESLVDGMENMLERLGYAAPEGERR